TKRIASTMRRSRSTPEQARDFVGIEIFAVHAERQSAFVDKTTSLSNDLWFPDRRDVIHVSPVPLTILPFSGRRTAGLPFAPHAESCSLRSGLGALVMTCDPPVDCVDTEVAIPHQTLRQQLLGDIDSRCTLDSEHDGERHPGLLHRADFDLHF